MQKKNDERKLEVYNFINDFIKEYGVCPSYDEIASSIGCAKSTLFKYMKRLEEEGYIERYGRNQVVTVENSNSIDRVPVIGSVACGKPKLAIEDIQGYLPTQSCDVKCISLIVDEANLRKRLTKDVESGIRVEDIIERSIARIPMYDTLNTIKIDTNEKTVAMIANEIKQL